MAYFISDDNGFVVDVATIGGIEDMRAEVDKAKTYPATKRLFYEGTLDSDSVDDAIKEMDGNALFSDLRSALEIAQGDVTLTDGVSDE